MSLAEFHRHALSLRNMASVAGWSALAFAALASSTLASSWGVTLMRGGSPWQGDNLLIGLVCSLISLLFAGVFHLRKETAQLRVSDREMFDARIQAVLDDLGYVTQRDVDGRLHARPRFGSLLFGGGVTVKRDGHHVAITGPRYSLDLIRRRYRMASHLEKVQQSITDSRNRVAETYLKRLELSLRLEPDQIEDFHAKIVNVMAEHGAVLIDVQLMLISEDGMPESLWTRAMRPWLERERIHHEFRRDHTQRATIGAISGESSSDSYVDTCVWS